MEDRKLLYSLMEGVLIIYNEHKAVNDSKPLLDVAENVTESTKDTLTVPWRLIILMMSTWFLTVLTWLVLSLSSVKGQPPPPPPAGDHSPRTMHRARRHAYAPNYHTHFHCSCNRHQLGSQQQLANFSNEDLFADMNANHHHHTNMFDVHAPPRRADDAAMMNADLADDAANMQISTPLDLNYEISV